MLLAQVEKEDLIQQLHQCKAELSSLQVRSSQPVQRDSKNSATNAPVLTKPPGTVHSREELETQNAALLGQMLILEDQLSESEVLLQESRNSRQQSAEQLNRASKELSDCSTRVASLEREKCELETELNAAKTSLEASEARLEECRTQLSLVECKLSSAGNRQRQLMCHKQQLESENSKLLQKLQQAGAASMQNAASSSSHGASVNIVGHGSSHVKVKENQIPSSSKLSAETLQRSGNQQMMKNVDGARGSLITHAASQVSKSADHQLVPCTTSPAALLGVCKTPTSAQIEDTGDSAGPLKRRIVDCTVDTDEKHRFLNVGNQQMGQ